MLALRLFVAFALTPVFLSAAPPLWKKLPPEKVAALKNFPCSFIHVWATWCTICVQELPELVRILSSEKKVKSSIIDISDPFVQDNFSKKYIQQIKPSFPLYLKTDVPDKQYMSMVVSDWNGGLPYSVLYKSGKKVKEWRGEFPLKELSPAFAALCAQ